MLNHSSTAHFADTSLYSGADYKESGKSMEVL
jgi:hypothetical protein